MKSKKYALANKNRCVACGECVRVCHRNAIEIIKGCYAFVDKETCVGCGLCVKNCPADCILLTEREADENAQEMV